MNEELSIIASRIKHVLLLPGMYAGGNVDSLYVLLVNLLDMYGELKEDKTPITHHLSWFYKKYYNYQGNSWPILLFPTVDDATQMFVEFIEHMGYKDEILSINN